MRISDWSSDVCSSDLELELLAGGRPQGLDEVRRAAATLLQRGPKVVLVTSLAAAGNDAGEMEMLAVTPEDAWRVATPRLPMTPNGAGDAVAALLDRKSTRLNSSH